jgi:hypothetical protein
MSAENWDENGEIFRLKNWRMNMHYIILKRKNTSHGLHRFHRFFYFVKRKNTDQENPLSIKNSAN